MADFSISTALGLMRRTAPFVFFRMAVYGGIAAAYVVVSGAGAGIGYGVGAFWDGETQLSAAMWGGIGGFGLTAGILYLLREYILYIVKAGHIAVMVELLEGNALPAGRGQIAFARERVAERFGQTNVLFALDQMVKGVIGAITGLLEGLMSLVPIPGLGGIMAILRAFLKVAVGLLDEIVLAYCFRLRAQDAYAASRSALVLYAQNARPMLVNAAWVTVLSWLLTALLFLVMLAPAGAIVWLMPGEFGAGVVLFALVFAWAAKAALIEPFALACMLQAYARLTAGQVPDPAWEAKLDGVSDTFRGLGERGLAWGKRRVGATA